LVGDEERDGLNLEIIRSLPVSLPSISEQTNIAAFLNRETARSDFLIQKINFSIDTLREYRSALISAAVTGKIDVQLDAET
jgi:restriction endonuclease S subunit